MPVNSSQMQPQERLGANITNEDLNIWAQSYWYYWCCY